MTSSEDKTQQLGYLLGQLATEPLALFIQGTLGAGKSVLARGVARGLGVAEDIPITSPTFTLMNHYPARLDLYHFDLYRICDADELVELGFDEYVFGDGVALVEWPERLEDEAEGVWISIEPLDIDQRLIQFKALGEVATAFLKRLQPQLDSCGTVTID
jgi:tRNA threonylcarbamoyladenosine biosynthesis protein TsaE